MNRWREIAKFLSGLEAFHAIAHGYLWLSGTVVTFAGLTFTPSWNLIGVVVNGALSLGLGLYAWRRSATRETRPVARPTRDVGAAPSV